MKIALNEVVFTSTEWTATEHGTVRSNLDKTDTFKLAKLKADKLATLMITEKGHKAPNKQIVASKNVSALIKQAAAKGASNTSILRALLDLNVISNDKGFFITLPMGEVGESFNLAQVEKVESAFSPEDLVAL